ncbi:MAG: hypothetical protein ACRECP_11530 [Methylocella sp.]
MTERRGMNKSHRTSPVQLFYPAPASVRALVEGLQPVELTPTRLLPVSKDLPHAWIGHRHFLGLADGMSVICGRNPR